MDDGEISGKIRVAAFLPRYIKEMDTTAGGKADDYDENEAVAIYDYKVFMKSIDATEAAAIKDLAVHITMYSNRTIFYL